MANPFIEGYKKATSNSNYLNFKEEGVYLFRILTPKTEVITYYRGFKETAPEGESKKVILPDNADGIIPAIPEGVTFKVYGNENPIKLVWAVKVFNHDTKTVQALEIDKKSIRDALFSIATGKIKNDWTKFDIQVTRKGQQKETEYFVVAGDTQELSDEAKQIIDNTPFDLSQMEKGGDPFELVNFDDIKVDMPF